MSRSLEPAGHCIGPNFLNRPTVQVARSLLGHWLCKRVNTGVVRFMLTEVEAYDGPEDLASHGSKGRTSRNSVIFGPAGYWYVYLCYGMYWMLNIVTGAQDYPAAILIRSTEKIQGPGRLTRFLGINGSHNGTLCTPENGLWLEYNEAVPTDAIIATPRVGVDYAGPIWSQKPYRFLLQTKNASEAD